MPFVKFVKEQRTDAVQIGISKHLTHEDALGDKKQARLGTGGIIQTNTISHLIPDTTLPFVSDASGKHPSRQTAWLENHGAARTQNPGIKEHLGDLCRLSRAGGSLDNHAVPLDERGNERLTQLLDGEI